MTQRRHQKTGIKGDGNFFAFIFYRDGFTGLTDFRTVCYQLQFVFTERQADRSRLVIGKDRYATNRIQDGFAVNGYTFFTL